MSAAQGPEPACMKRSRSQSETETADPVKRSDVTGNRFEWELGENKAIKDPLPILHCIS